METNLIILIYITSEQNMTRPAATVEGEIMPISVVSKPFHIRFNISYFLSQIWINIELISMLFLRWKIFENACSQRYIE